MINLEELIKNSKKANDWDLGNQVLYNLCEDNFKHEKPNEIIAKIWLIGRAYSASIERRKEVKIGEDFWKDNVVPKIEQSDIDVWLNNRDNSDDINVFMETHKNVTKLFKDITGLDKRSLASKYLHFHLPNKFYIYDSIASRSIKFLQKEKIEIKTDANWDDEYSKFYQNCDYLKNKLQNKFEINLSCRELDNLLTSREITKAIANKQ
ncbi:MAG: hypothetical protein WCR42_09140 [bacterium]